MTGSTGGRSQLPHVVATGFTTALLGDERTLREFAIGDHVVRTLREQGAPAVLYLINDSYDPLNERQLRIAVERDERLIRQFNGFCGLPIAEIPDPYECHPTFARHYQEALLDRLYALDIHPLVIDTHALYREGAYVPYVRIALERFEEIQRTVASALDDFTLRHVFRVQCSACDRIDVTTMRSTRGLGVTYRCERCDAERFDEAEKVRGKLGWKLDCAARWNIFGIGTEVFGKAHWAERSTLEVAEVVSAQFFGGRIPTIVRYGDLRLSRALSGKLLQVLPAPLFKRLLIGPLLRDLDLTPEYVEHFAETVQVRPGMTYAEYIRRELPRRALEARFGPAVPRQPLRRPDLSDAALVFHGNEFSECFHGRRHEVRMPDASALAESTAVLRKLACDLIDRVLVLRKGSTLTQEEIKRRLRAFLAGQPAAPRLYPLLRALLRQEHGPNLTTMLGILPEDYLRGVRAVIVSHPLLAEDRPGDDGVRQAA